MNDLDLLMYINFFAPAVHLYEQIIQKYLVVSELVGLREEKRGQGRMALT
jgi:hypothetical protein